MAFILLALYATIVIIPAIYLLFKIQFQYWRKRGVPYIKPVIPFGSLGKFGQRTHVKDTFEQTYRAFKDKAPFAGMFAFLHPVTLAIDLDFIHRMLIEDFNLFIERGLYYNERDDPLSAHLVTIGGQKWRVLRTKLTPTFTSGKMKYMYPTILKVTKELDETVQDLLKIQNDLEIKDLLSRFTTDIIGTAVFGIECNSLKNPNLEFRKMGRSAFENPRHSILGRAFLMQFSEMAVKLGVKIVRDEISEFFMKVVRDTIDYREKNNIRQNDFMDLLIQIKNGKDIYGKLTFEEIAAQAFIFFLAGFETSSTNMAYTLYELSMNPEIQDRARQEINEVLEKHDGQFTYEAMMQMTYIDRIIYESLRKHPPAISLARVAGCDYKVPKSDKIMKKGTRIFIPVYSIHNDPEIYPEPEIFNPDRFLPEEVKKRHPMSFLGFGDGPRICIGARFGLIQSRMGLISLLRKYRFKPCSRTPEKIEYSTETIILTPKGDLWLNAEPIE